jgi:CheY-like chemotaxis protein
VTPKLLLADDSVTIQRVIELTFADENVQVVAVGDGKQAIDRVQSDPPDIVLADVGMPERDGYQVAEFIKGDPRLAHIPVLLLTGAFEPVDDVRARAIGCEGVLVKPFEPQMVISKVRELLSGPRGKSPEVPAPPAAIPSGIPGLELDRLEPAAVAPAPAAGDALEDYFDRLDAALANLGTAAPPAPLEPEPEPVSIITPVEQEHPAAMPSSPAPVLRTFTAPSVTPAGEIPAGPLPPLHAAFTALLAAEQGKPVEVPLPVQEPLSEETIEDIVGRVVARMGDDKMRALVLDTAERLVREEIDRIKKQA